LREYLIAKFQIHISEEKVVLGSPNQEASLSWRMHLEKGPSYGYISLVFLCPECTWDLQSKAKELHDSQLIGDYSITY